MFDRMIIKYDIDYPITSAKEANSECRRLEKCNYAVEETATSTGYHVRAEKKIKSEADK